MHIMKSAGTTFKQQVRQTLAPRELRDLCATPLEEVAITGNVAHLAATDAEKLATVSFFTGHLPLVAGQIVAPDAATLTLLRDPVDRAISYLKVQRRRHRPEASLEEIYDQEWLQRRAFDDHQTKVIAMTAEEALASPSADDVVDPPPEGWSPEELEAIERGGPTESLPLNSLRPRLAARIYDVTIMRPLDMDRSRLSDAKRALDEVDVVGVTEDYGRFLAQAEQLLGTSLEAVEPQLVSEPEPVSDAFRRRVLEDNQLDAELHAYACELARSRG